MKKNLMILAVAALAVFASCSDKKTAQSVIDKVLQAWWVTQLPIKAIWIWHP